MAVVALPSQGFHYRTYGQVDPGPTNQLGLLPSTFSVHDTPRHAEVDIAPLSLLNSAKYLETSNEVAEDILLDNLDEPQRPHEVTRTRR